jgi:hypothetical protein
MAPSTRSKSDLYPPLSREKSKEDAQRKKMEALKKKMNLKANTSANLEG